MKTFPSAIWTLLLIGLLQFTLLNARGHIAAEEMAATASKFLSSLSPEQKAKASFDFKDEERANWHYIPKDRKGLPLKEMTAAQRPLAHALLAAGMSHRGYAKATNIMSLELILQDIEGPTRRFPRDPDLYYVSIFGKPEPKGTWGWRVEGHHLAVNFSIVKGEHMAATPSFFGSNPAEVKSGARKGTRVLAEEEDLARQLAKSLSDDQKKAAVFTTTAPKEIFTEAKRQVKPLDTTGIPASKLSNEQSEMLLKLIKEYVYRHRSEVADEDLKKIQKAGVEKIFFAWAGGLERGEGHYYRVQGPTFLLEYDNTQNNNNHIHAVWRDFENDFGEDLLRKHYQETPHP